MPRGVLYPVPRAVPCTQDAAGVWVVSEASLAYGGVAAKAIMAPKVGAWEMRSGDCDAFFGRFRGTCSVFLILFSFL